MGKEIVYFLRDNKTLVAAWPKTGITIVFDEEEKKWSKCIHAFSQIEGEIAYKWGSAFRQASEEEAQAIFGNIPPDKHFYDQ